MALPVIVISGPTGSGKSGVAAQICQELNGEIINADSVSIYREFDIGSAKPDPATLAVVPHHLVSKLNPNENFSAGAFAKLASQAISEISRRGKIPVVVGGTGLYIRALISGLRDFGPTDQRAIALLQANEHRLFDLLRELDAEAASRIHPHHTSRIRRAIAVALSSGRSLVETDSQEQPILALRGRIFWLHPEREVLYQGINDRVQSMLKRGLVAEVQNIRAKWGSDIPPLRAIGYQQVLRVLEQSSAAEADKCPLVEAGSRQSELRESELLISISQATRRFAKRQLTWWRNEPNKLKWQIMQPPLSAPSGGLGELLIRESQAFLNKSFSGGERREVICSEVMILK